MSIPKDPYMLMSYINTQLRDNYDSLDSLCAALDLDRSSLEKTLASVDLHYNSSLNQFK
ncbi:DUF4250 domain-containing protein [Oribacterium sp. C9]|uniref:DUF4250 domain-containing protein n=1 Tax=Oribacterium sp. C9 TaxID=1943579 RepID=UPI00098F99EA|nr:DUF4250 domain-containing protein [Oribacterium sp. C9]OON88082.1 DUF4250 domain-containing protein [Oribacterium sp. C9]